MAVITRTIGSGRNHTTWTLWEDDLDDGGIYSAADDVIGDVYDDAAYDENIVINGGGTLGLNSVTLTAASGEEHDGTEGSGARNVRTGGTCLSIATPSGFNNNYTVSWLEIDMNGNNGPAVNGNSQQFNNVGVLKNCILHGQSGGDSFNGIVYAVSRDLLVMNNFVYDNTRSTGLTVYGLQLDADQASGGAYNNTIYDINNTGSGDVNGIRANTNSTNHDNKNNISIGNSVSTGTLSDFSYAGTNIDADYNLSSDATADDAGGSNHQLSKTLGDQFVSTGTPPDLRLKSGSDAIDNGVDLVTTPSGVEVDILGRDRDTEGDTWDIGAHEFVSTGTNISATVDALTLTEQSASIAHDIVVTSVVDALTLTENAATVSLGVNVLANTAALTLIEQTASIVFDSNISANTDSLALTSFAASISYDTNVNTNVDALVVTSLQATVDASTEISTNVDVLTLTEFAATITHNVNVNAAVDALTLTSYTAEVNASTEVNANVDTLTLTELTSSVAHDVTVTTALTALTLTTYAASISAGTNIGANTASLTLTEQVATVTYDVEVTTIVDSLTIVSYAATISEGVNVEAATAALTLTPNAANITYDVNVDTTTATLNLTSYSASISTGASIIANTANLVLTEQAAGISLDIDIATSVDALTLSNYAASVTLDTLIETNPTNLTLTTYSASTSLDINVYTDIERLTLLAKPCIVALYEVQLPTTSNSIINVNLGNVPQIDDPQAYEALLELHNAVEAILEYLNSN